MECMTHVLGQYKYQLNEGFIDSLDMYARNGCAFKRNAWDNH